MKTKEEYISLIQDNNDTIRRTFGVKSMRLFGSVARGEHKEESDVDVCVEMEPKMMLVLRLKGYLEKLLQTSVDVVRMHTNINPVLKTQIENDGIVLW